VVFFGDPRKPPPIEAARDVKYHGSLLRWARHATVAPRTSEERLDSVFPRGRLAPEAPKYRLTNSPAELTYQMIFDGFVKVRATHGGGGGGGRRLVSERVPPAPRCAAVGCVLRVLR
jgi:hypothetical protein